MPMAEKSAASSGIEMTPPQKRGATTRATGSTAIISIAESCSVAFMRPISAVMAGPALGDDAAGGHEIDVIDHAERLLHVVRDDDRSGAERIVELADQAHDDAEGDRVEAGERLVVENQLRVERDRAGERHAARHAAGEL